MMLMYTDGITEARRDGRFLEITGVASLLDKHAGEPAQDVVRGIYHDVEDYTGGAIHDDIALMLLRVPEDADDAPAAAGEP
jgi:sigma-B regulation protein RsbU (phosphoserine phosphatase)